MRQSLTSMKIWFRMSMVGTVGIEGAIAIAVPAMTTATVTVTVATMVGMVDTHLLLVFRSSPSTSMMMTTMAGEGMGVIAGDTEVIAGDTEVIAGDTEATAGGSGMAAIANGNANTGRVFRGRPGMAARILVDYRHNEASPVRNYGVGLSAPPALCEPRAPSATLRYGRVIKLGWMLFS